MEVPVNGVAKGIEAAEEALSSGSRKTLSKLGEPFWVSGFRVLGFSFRVPGRVAADRMQKRF